ncbi:MAG: gluconate 2-dehydrogenase subunit 3 family protein [Bacteroidetes bacterium]|nr:gluconate 2-dehydrogenase subunit 3 family protein [Bacteroidota bacterium]
MDRRKSIKLIATGTIASPFALESCKNSTALNDKQQENFFNLDRSPDELLLEKKILAKGSFFTPHEMSTLTVLVDIILPADKISESASQAGVPAFLDFIVNDMPDHQLQMRGGLHWLDMYCFKIYNQPFVNCKLSEQLAVIDQIAYPEKAAKAVQQGVSFFTLLRNLTATGFFTSAMGVKDLGYVGNQPTQWNGVPSEVLQEFGLAYSANDNKVCISYDNPA